MKKLTVNKHDWQIGQTNEYCKHCGLIFESDLGWTSADGVKCIDREISEEKDIPEIILSYAKFNGLIWKSNIKRFIKPYSNIKLSLRNIELKIQRL